MQAYLFAVCAGSSLDQQLNNFSLFNLVEQLQAPKSGLGKVIPFEVHIYWRLEDDDREKEFEFRIARQLTGGQTLEYGASIPFKTAALPKFRMRVGAFRVPSEYGDYILRLQWRRVGADTWLDDVVSWPFSVTPVQRDNEAPPPSIVEEGEESP